MRPAIGEVVNAAPSGGSARVAEGGRQDARDPRVNNDPAFDNRRAFDALVDLPSGERFRTQVWWTGSRWSYHATGPHFVQVRRGITLAELDPTYALDAR